jgi:hypothetical protein
LSFPEGSRDQHKIIEVVLLDGSGICAKLALQQQRPSAADPYQQDSAKGVLLPNGKLAERGKGLLETLVEAAWFLALRHVVVDSRASSKVRVCEYLLRSAPRISALELVNVLFKCAQFRYESIAVL